MTITTAQLNSLRQERDRLRELLALQRECAELSTKLMLGDAKHIGQMRTITESVAEHYGVTVEQIVSSSRTEYLSMARHVSWYLCRTKIDPTLAEMTKAFNRHHTSFIHGFKRVCDLLDVDEQFAAELRDLSQAVDDRLSIEINHKETTRIPA